MRGVATVRKKTDSSVGSLKRASIQPPEGLVPKDVLDRVREKKKQIALGWLEKYVDKYGEVPSISEWNSIRKKDAEFKNAPSRTSVGRYFGSWNAFIEAGGYKPFDYTDQFLSTEELEQRKNTAIDYLQKYFEKYGNVPSSEGWDEIRKKDSEFKIAPCSATIESHFTSWNGFIETSGYEPNERGFQKVSHEELQQRRNESLEYLHKYVDKYGEVPSLSKWDEARENDPEFKDMFHSATISRDFTSWRAFIEKAGYSPYDPDGQRLSEEEWQLIKSEALIYLHSYVEKFGSVPTATKWNEARENDPEFKNAPSTGGHGFGSWNDFLKAGGYKIHREHELLDEERKKEMETLFKNGKSHLEIASVLGCHVMTVSRNLRKSGFYTSRFVKRNLASISIITSSQIDGVKLYDGEGKRRIRGMMLESTVDNLSNPFDVNYIGFPSANFVDYSLVYDEIGVSPEESLAVERERKTANIMRSIVDNFAAIIGGERFEGLNLHEGPLVRAVTENPEMQFNFFSLDFLGGWSPGKERSVDLLFANGQIADEAVMYLTLNNSMQERMRLLRGRGPVPPYRTNNQYVLATTALKLAAQRNGFAMQELFTTEYQDSRIPMLVIGAKFERVDI